MRVFKNKRRLNECRELFGRESTDDDGEKLQQRQETMDLESLLSTFFAVIRPGRSSRTRRWKLRILRVLPMLNLASVRLADHIGSSRGRS